MRKHGWRVLWSLVLVAVFAGHCMGWWQLPMLARVESVLYDARVRLVAPGTVDDRIVIVDIDEKSLREKDQGGEGRWPWRRDRLAALVTTLFQQYGVTLVATDIILSEKDASSGLEVLEQLAANELKDNAEFAAQLELLRPSLAFDHLLGEAMQGGPVVLGYAFHNDKPSESTVLPPGLDPAAWGLTAVRAQSYPGFTGLLPELQSQAAGAGHLNPLRDDDGGTRRVPLLIEHHDRYYPALSLAVLQTVMGGMPLDVGVAAYADTKKIETIKLGPIEVPVDAALNALVPFRGASHSFPYVSAVDVLQGRVAPAQLKDRIILLGTSAAGLADLVATPVGVSFPGVEVHANVITGMLDGRIAHTPAYAQGVELLGVLVLGALMVLGGMWRKPAYTVVLFLLAGLGTAAANVAMLKTQQLMLPLAAPVLCLLSVFLFQMIYGFFIESRGKRQMSDLFANYVPPELVEKMADNPQAFSMAPEERELTVLFSDVRDFTTISERLSPQELAELINQYLTAMSEIIRDGHHGTLDKYIGDAVMAFWGAPVPDPKHAEDAVLAAIAMQVAAHALNTQFVARGWPKFKIGIGLNTGPMTVGDMGSKVRRAYTVMGDSVNLGARLEGLTKVYGVEILVGENTQAKLPDWTWREVDRVRVKGKDVPVAMFEPVGRTSEVAPETLDELAAWRLALDAYRGKDWTQAKDALTQLRSRYPEHSYLYGLYLNRVNDFEMHPPPPDWDGATNFETK